ncbi:hypothetical protein BGZ61DRAFT_466418 [Ilyonectria robusta]|uniref:uncharacterized protein n=1 Tax=Ilyonectria robusta TaxID=1079257 RepID=UPI001E8D56F8|nr:uncharacterized protein BGZ61DRAFT_466418 [Ilyonectria robusta]KAH8656423.1 hypothetical protein BGZ61DRAFT_466418 [Ilyonectria robusta]
MDRELAHFYVNEPHDSEAWERRPALLQPMPIFRCEYLPTSLGNPGLHHSPRLAGPSPCNLRRAGSCQSGTGVGPALQRMSPAFVTPVAACGPDTSQSDSSI